MICIFIGFYIELPGLFVEEKSSSREPSLFLIDLNKKSVRELCVREKRQFQFVCLNFNRYSIPLYYRNNQFWLTLHICAYYFIIMF